MIDPATITATATAIAVVIFNKAVERGGENLGEAVSNKISELLNFVQGKFQQESVEGKLLKAQENPSEKNKDRFTQELEIQMEDDGEFAKKLVELKEQLENLEGGRQIMASGLKLEGDLKAKDIKQKGGEFQEMLTDIVAENITVGNLSQENGGGSGTSGPHGSGGGVDD